MSRAQKLLEAMRANPKNDWQMADVERLANAYGVSLRRPKGGSSHATLSHPSQDEILTVPAAKPIKVIYIVKLVLFIDSVVGSES
ncbi:type II toxin-antitoxin system HicA family toxin [Sphingomonas populi]|uniref:Type II toxin-antitoxin system HicA family toxin n=1 Tax=Sphingomonas populi TaxID=2484750 RepID=A0A4Q6Y2N9_9SPHN|nr:type II toxin-antitoxin system HicA family toxin [Sphingomonas populi]RZF64004.1 type II toxin-antitoxin system HicA family toxin [Sphingomonas populi]